MSSSLPRTTRALVVQKDAQERKPVYHDTEVVERPIPSLKQGEILVKIGAAAFNHRDVCASDNFLFLCQLNLVRAAVDPEGPVPWYYIWKYLGC